MGMYPVLVGMSVIAALIIGFAVYFRTRYVAKAGDNLYAIARRYRTTSSALAGLNRLPHKNAIKPGQHLVVPHLDPAPKRPPKHAYAEVIRKGPNSPIVAFSFDAGSGSGYTDHILRVLEANGLTVSFGVTGAWAKQNPDLLRRIVEHGHHLINHSNTHPNFRDLTRSARRDELDETEAAITAITGLGTKPYFRPPFGAYNSSVLRDLAKRGYVFNVMWTIDSLGWKGLTVDEIVTLCLSRAEPGAIYLFHVGSRSQDGPALQSIIDGLRARSFSIGSVADILGH